MVSLLLLAACASTVRDLPAGSGAEEGDALLAGRLSFGGTRIAPKLRLRSPGGRDVIVKPEHETFLVAVPSGTYEIERFGDYRPANDRLVIEAAPGPARYVGTFAATRDRYGALRVVVRDEIGRVEADLRRRYGEAMPGIEPELARSSLEPLENGELVVAVERVTYPSFAYGHAYLHYGYFYGYSPYCRSYPYRRYHHHRRHR